MADGSGHYVMRVIPNRDLASTVRVTLFVIMATVAVSAAAYSQNREKPF